MKPVLIAMTIASALSVMWVADQIECLIYPGTDACVGCADDCLEPDETGETITE